MMTSGQERSIIQRFNIAISIEHSRARKTFTLPSTNSRRIPNYIFVRGIKIMQRELRTSRKYQKLKKIRHLNREFL